MAKEILKDKFNAEIIEKLKDVVVDDTIKVVLINNVKLISKEITYDTECLELIGESLQKIRIKLPDAFQLQDKESLLMLLLHLRKNFRSTRVMISTYGHGSMFGIFTSRNYKNDKKLTNYTAIENRDLDYWNVVSPNLMKRGSLNIGEERIEYLVAARPFSNDKYLYKTLNSPCQEIIVLGTNGGGQNFKVLSNEEFAWAIKKSFGKIDFLIFNNCVMQNIYVQHSFRGVVDYLIAPTTGIVYPCFNLRGIIDFLKAGTRLENPEISRFIAEKSFREGNNDYPMHSIVIEEFIVVSMRLDNLTDIFNILQEIKEFLETELVGADRNSFACAIANSLEETYPMEYNTFTGETVFDLLQILESDYLKEYVTLQNFRQRLLKIISSGSDFIHTFTGSTAYHAGYKEYYRSKKNITVSGICIYFPKNIDENEYIKPFFNSISYENDLEKGMNWYRDVIKAYLTVIKS